ncbi:MAG: ATP-binding protein [Bacteroidales bacterium]|nr:ATP-binding protein [Bacteroidales bacterium]
MKRSLKYKTLVPYLLMLLAVLSLALSAVRPGLHGGFNNEAQHVGEVIQKRMDILDSYMDKAINGDVTEWMDLDDLPDDMIIYRYFEDELQSWKNQFPVSNDDISTKMVFQRLVNPRVSLSSPLSDIDSKVRLVNLGNDWYLAHSRDSLSCKVIGALLIQGGAMDFRRPGSLNKAFKLDMRFSIDHLSSTEGSPVFLGDTPVFKLLCHPMPQNGVGSPHMIWLALMLSMVALLVAIAQKRTIRRAAVCSFLMFLFTAGLYVWGRGVRFGMPLFSPLIYADGPVLYSLAAVLLINLLIFFMVSALFLVRRSLYRMLLASRSKKIAMALWAAVDVIIIIALLFYVHFLTQGIIRNSNIRLELYRLQDVNGFTAIVYGSLLLLLMSLPMLVHLLAPVVKEFTGRTFNAFSALGRTILALFIAVYMVSISAVLGFRTEQDRLSLLANRLAMDRDLFAELQLRSIEPEIGEDAIIASLSVLPNSGTLILNRLVDNLMSGIAQNFDISVAVIPEDSRNPALFALIQERLSNGTPIYDNSHFIYSSKSPGHPQYSGLFTYFNEKYGVSHVLLTLEPKSNREDRGYSSMMGITAPGRVTIPPHYSYARYAEDVLISFRGRYTYPTRLSSELHRDIYENKADHLKMDGYRHYVTHISDNEVVIISQAAVGLSYYAVAIAFLGLVSFGMVSLPGVFRRRSSRKRGYFQSRITSVLMVSLILTLIAMASVSIYFVYSRNTANRNALMSDKITSIRAIVENSVKGVEDTRELYSPEFREFLETASRMAGLDITVYAPDGKVFMSTTPDMFDMFRRSRVNEDAYESIVYEHKGYFIDYVSIGRGHYHAMYAPVMNGDDNMVAIISSPYIDDHLDFETEAVIHMVTIFVLFVILLLFARLIINALSTRIFKPLNEMGLKMKDADIATLETIEYDRNDEISTLVDAYNRMVGELQESSHKLAMAERDKAWTGMARQVAHEIKNPLTPMKLQMQRLMRLKQRNAPGWEEKFDEVANTVLEHIDILTDTANEFSTFAKLYAEEPSDINLDALLQEEKAMFDNKDNIRFSYMGLDDAHIMGPKPQLTRVFVNLLTNSVQAIENSGSEDGSVGSGTILISLRNSVKDGWYDIVFEDSGPGVSSENVEKLFTPNFTTKTGGAGIGLAICRSILDRCGAEISYSRSFALGGACFTIRYPKK